MMGHGALTPLATRFSGIRWHRRQARYFLQCDCDSASADEVEWWSPGRWCRADRGCTSDDARQHVAVRCRMDQRATELKKDDRKRKRMKDPGRHLLTGVGNGRCGRVSNRCWGHAKIATRTDAAAWFGTLDISKHRERRKPATPKCHNSHSLCTPMASSSPENALPKSAHPIRALFGSLLAPFEWYFTGSKAPS